MTLDVKPTTGLRQPMPRHLLTRRQRELEAHGYLVIEPWHRHTRRFGPWMVEDNPVYVSVRRALPNEYGEPWLVSQPIMFAVVIVIIAVGLLITLLLAR